MCLRARELSTHSAYGPWATNGCPSVTGTVLAALLAIHIGFTAVIVVALVLYTVAATARP